MAFVLKCPYCGSPAPLQNSKLIYKGRDYGLMYICSKYPECDTYVGCNKVSGKPNGTLANKELRELRKKARTAFEALFMNKVIDEREHGANVKKHNIEKIQKEILAQNLGIPSNRCNFNYLNVDMCEKVIAFCESKSKDKK